MNRKTFGVGLCTALLCASCMTGGSVFLAGAEGETAASSSDDWVIVNQVEGMSGTDFWTISPDGTTLTAGASVNGDASKNFAVTKDEDSVGNYSVSAHFQMTEDPVQAEGNQAKIGIVPWYLDENNYIMVNLWWRNEAWCGGNGQVLANVTMEGKQDGAYVQTWQGGSFVPAQWSDFWLNNAVVSNPEFRHPINYENGWDVRIVKRVSDPTVSADESGEILEVYVNGTITLSVTVNLPVTYRATPVYAGVSMQNTPGLVVTEFGVEDVDVFEEFGFNYLYSDFNYNPLGGGASLTATGPSWSYDGGVYTGSAVGAHEETPVNAVGTVSESFANYAVEADVTLTSAASGTGTQRAGLAVWFRDLDNYLNADLVCTDGTYTAQISGMIGGEAVASQASSALSVEGNSASLRAEKIGSSVVMYVDEQEACRYTASVSLENAYAGVNLYNAAATFSGYEVSERDYVPYSEYRSVLGGTAFTLSSQTLTDFTEADGVISIDATDFTSNAYAVTARDTFGETTVSVEITPVSVGTEYAVGIVGYYESAENYLYGVINGTKAILYRHAGTEDTVLAEADYTFDASAGEPVALSMVISESRLALLAGEEELVSADYSLAPDAGKFGGFIVKSGSFRFGMPAFDGWRAWEPNTVGVWSCAGPELTTWTLNENGDIVGDVADATTNGYMSTRALREIGFKDNSYYVYTVVHTTKWNSGMECRAAIYPWYLDANNYVVVTASHAYGNSPEVTVEARINGAVIPMKWDSFTGAMALLDSDVTVEVYVDMENDRVLVYNGRQRDPFYSFDVPGMAAASRAWDGTVQAGVGVNQIAAIFKDFGAAETMTSNDTVAPVIELLGTPVKTATVGSTVILPVVDVTDNLGESINAVFTVTDPDGIVLDLKGGARFTAEKEGAYTVSITAADSWGNEAESYEYTITVTQGDAGGDDGDGPNVGLIVGLTVAGVVVVAAAVVAVIMIRKKKSGNPGDSDGTKNG